MAAAASPNARQLQLLKLDAPPRRAYKSAVARTAPHLNASVVMGSAKLTSLLKGETP